MSKIQLVETYFAKLIPLEEAASDNPAAPKKMRVEMRCQQGDVVNQNRRKYTTKLLSREVEGIQESVKARKVYMAVDHPEGVTASLRDAGAILTRLEMRGTEVIGEAEILNTSAGRDLAEIIRAGGQVGVSSRGSGSVKTESREDGSTYELVQEDFKLISFDFVGEPSLASAGITSHVEEAKGGSLNMDVKTLAELKEKHPALFESLRKEAAAELEKDVETKLTKRVDEQVAAQKEAIRKEVLKEMADETVGKTGAGYFALAQAVQAMLAKAGFQVSLDSINSLLQADDPNKKQGLEGVPGRQSGYGKDSSTGDASVAGAKIEGLLKSHSELMEQVVKLSTQLEKEKTETFIEKALQSFPAQIREHMRVRLMTAKTIDEAKAAVASESKLVEQLAKAVNAPAGKGHQFASDANPEKQNINENAQMAVWARLCGTDQN